MTDSERKLVVIVAIDVVGYSASIEQDETNTVAKLKQHRSKLDPMIDEYGGRIFNTGGDSVFAEFASAVQALKCVIAFQKHVYAENSALLPHDQMLFRIGVNIGDVLEDGENLLGDGVNVAARLESICQQERLRLKDYL